LQPSPNDRPRTLLQVFLLFVGALTCLPAGATAARDAEEYFFNETFGNLPDELALAKQEHKKGILLFFEQEDCPFCHRMKTTVLNQPEVQDYYKKHFHIFSVDIEGDLEVTDFQGHPVTQKDFAFKEYKVRATPVFAFFNLDGKLVTRYTGPTKNAREFLWLGEYVADGHYQSETFAQFKHGKQQAAGTE
jgi:thioredoxin-related protein